MPHPTITREFIDNPDPLVLVDLPVEQAAQLATVGIFILLVRIDEYMQHDHFEEGRARAEGRAYEP